MQRLAKAGSETIAYELIKTARRSLELRVLPDGIRLFAPSAFPLRQADAYVADHIGWIREAQARLNAYADRERSRFPMTEGMCVPIEGSQYVLRLAKAAKTSARLEGDELILSAPDLAPDAVADALRAFLIDLAHERINERLEHYIPLIGRSPNRVAIREQRTKWGSCSSQNNLNFNWKLIMAPCEALDYVVIHELCHLYEFNHSAQFWRRVERYQPDYAVWRDFLRSGWNHPFA